MKNHSRIALFAALATLAACGNNALNESTDAESAMDAAPEAAVTPGDSGPQLGRPCTLASECRAGLNQVSACVANHCAFACSPGFDTCGAGPEDGCPTVTSTDIANCGSCRHACPMVANGTAACVAGECTAACAAGFLDCDHVAENGCEVDGRTNASHCGTCVTACPSAPHAAGTCATSRCNFACDPGYSNCDSDTSNGCETFTGGTDLDHCGGCNTHCSVTDAMNAAPVCNNGTCSFTCLAGFADCNGTAADGCEVRLGASVANCGACGRACPTRAGATATCANSVCGFRCNPNTGDCDGNEVNGCEADLLTNADNCRTCGNVCSSAVNGTRVCAAATCRLACTGTFANCNTDLADGCEVNLGTNGRNCGACGTVCPGATNASPTCALGLCTLTCNPGFADCNGTSSDGCEADTRSNTASCGMCGRTCPSGPHSSPSCNSGACSIVCESGFADCNGNPADGCEVSLATSAGNCGGCGNVCATAAQARGVCSSGLCALVCNANFDDCDGSTANGCETDLRSTNTHCGTCATQCTSGTGPNTVNTCVASTCRPVCVNGYADCDHAAANGCEIQLAVNVNNCGVCGNACTVDPRAVFATPACNAGACTLACAAGHSNCDGDTSNGCEHLGATCN